MRTLTRETKQLQDKLAKILTDYGVNFDDGDLLQKLVAAYPTVTGTPRPDVNKYRTFSDKSNERTRNIGKLAERMKNSIGLTAILEESEWKYVLGELVDMEEKGWKWETFATWYKSLDKYHQPSIYQFSKKPKMLIEIYGTAFNNQPAPTFSRNADGSLNV